MRALFIPFLGLSLIFFTVNSCSIFDQGSQGKNLYEFYCSSCHMQDGQGLKSLYPPVAQSDYLTENINSLACIIRYGINDTIQVNGRTYNNPMVGIPKLNDVEIANVINYILQDLNGQKEFFISPKNIETQLSKCNNSQD